MQIKTTMNYPSHPLRWLLGSNCCGDAEKRGVLTNCWWGWKMVLPGQVLKGILMQQLHLQVQGPETRRQGLGEMLLVHTALFRMVKRWKQFKCESTMDGYAKCGICKMEYYSNLKKKKKEI